MHPNRTVRAALGWLPVALFAALLALILPAAAQQHHAARARHAAAPLPHGLYATFITGKGTIVVQLFPGDAPKTVQNFVDLAKGQKPFRDPLTGMVSTRPFYDGQLFYRIIPGQIIQTGDPSNSGAGNVGFTIPAESNHLKFDRAGRLSMAQADGDPSSRSTQIFITLMPDPQLDRQHFIIFGQVVQGLSVARAISAGPHRGEHPLRAVTLQKVVIEQK